MSKVLVIGASRGLGRETVRAALAAGHSVRAFSRSENPFGRSQARLEYRQGDARKREDLESALDGVDAAIQTLGIGGRDLFAPVTLFSEATRALVAAMAAGGVKRLIAVTGFAAGDSRAALSLLQRAPFLLLFGRAYADKDIQERLIRESSLDWTIARPGVLLPGPRRGRLSALVDPSQWRNGIVSRPDVADFLVEQIASSKYLRQAPVLVWG